MATQAAVALSASQALALLLRPVEEKTVVALKAYCALRLARASGSPAARSGEAGGALSSGAARAGKGLPFLSSWVAARRFLGRSPAMAARSEAAGGALGSMAASAGTVLKGAPLLVFAFSSALPSNSAGYQPVSLLLRAH